MFDSFIQRKDIFVQGNMNFIQKFGPLVKNIFETQLRCYHITFRMKFAWNKIVYLRQHFEEIVKPGKNLI